MFHPMETLTHLRAHGFFFFAAPLAKTSMVSCMSICLAHLIALTLVQTLIAARHGYQWRFGSFFTLQHL